MNGGNVPVPLGDRFWKHVQQGDGCWEWIAYRNEHGYGVVGVRGSRTMLAHRASWELTHGPIPAGMVVMHTCDNPACVRLPHLRLGTQHENIQDRHAKGRDRNNGPICQRGHPFTERLGSNGARKCWICKNANARERRRARWNFEALP